MSEKKNILLIANYDQRPLFSAFKDHLEYLGFEVDYCSEFVELASMLKNKNYFCTIVSMYSTCSLVGSTINFQSYADKYGIWSAGTMIVAPVLNEVKVPFLAFALTSEDVAALPENLSGLVWKGEIVMTKLTDRLFKILKNAESNDEKELKEKLSVIES